MRALRISYTPGSNFWPVYCAIIAFAIPWQRVFWVQKGVTPFHFLNAILLAVVILPFLWRHPVKFYFIGPLFVYMIGTVLGMFNSQFLPYNVYTIGQDLYLYTWFIFMCSLLRNEKTERFLVVAWILAAMVVVLWAAERSIFVNLDVMRFEFSFRNPNRAAAYMILSMALTFHPLVPWLLRVGIVGVLLKALLATGSAGGLLAFFAGTGILLVIWFYMRYGERLRLHALMLVALSGIILLGVTLMSGESLREGYSEATGQAGARVDRSSAVRQMIWAHGVATFEKHPLGIGPGSFFQQFPTEIGQDEKNVELHSDWFATLVERGLLGIAGLAALIIAVGVKLLKLIGLGLQATINKRYSLWIAALVGATASYIAMSFTHEILHHETFWLLMALVMGTISRLEEEINVKAAWSTPLSADAHTLLRRTAGPLAQFPQTSA